MSQQPDPKNPVATPAGAPGQLSRMSPRDLHRRTLGGIAQRAYQALVVSYPVAKIPESTFVNEILPYYCGEAINLELPKLIAAAAGGPFNEYDVVSAKGEVLFRAPPLLERRMFDFKEAANGLPMESIFQTAQLLMNRSPVQAEAFITEHLTRKGFSKNATEIFKEVIARRDAILERYGKTVTGSVSTAGGNPSSGNKQEFSPDDFDLL